MSKIHKQFIFLHFYELFVYYQRHTRLHASQCLSLPQDEMLKNYCFRLRMIYTPLPGLCLRISQKTLRMNDTRKWPARLRPLLSHRLSASNSAYNYLAIFIISVAAEHTKWKIKIPPIILYYGPCWYTYDRPWWWKPLLSTSLSETGSDIIHYWFTKDGRRAATASNIYVNTNRRRAAKIRNTIFANTASHFTILFSQYFW